MRLDGNTWRSSFSVDDGESNVIDAQHSVLTVFSGSTGSGGHASMFLERIESGKPKCYLIDLTEGGGVISIAKSAAQIIKGDNSVINMSLPKGGDPLKLSAAHRHSYAIDAERTEAVILAVDRFKKKAAAGRYVYRVTGGALGRMTSRYGTRGINCADFVIKILRDAGIKKVAYLLFDTPFRVAK
jgi:hypothetical protein